MPIELRSFARSVMSDDERREVEAVEMLADHLRDELVEREVAINQAHVVGAQSAAIQAIVAEVLTDELGFGQEVVLTPQDGIVTRARPDFVFQLSPGRGVMAEVERLERKYNGGQPFPAVGARELPQGRPMGE